MHIVLEFMQAWLLLESDLEIGGVVVVPIFLAICTILDCQ